MEAPVERQRLGLWLPTCKQLQRDAPAQARLLAGALPYPADRSAQGMATATAAPLSSSSRGSHA
eukprot:8879686-Alexandrium_andersonii.AAC.1